MLPSRNWTDLTTTDLASADLASTIAVLPVAAVEQHGPHLPLGTDAMIMDGYLDRVRADLSPDLPVVLLPAQAIGCSIEHTGFAGTLSLAARTALDAWTEIADSAIRAGIRKLVILNSHGGNSSVVDILAHDLRARHGVLAVLASWQRFGYPDGSFSDHERAHGIHGGAIETSLMLHLRPDLVRMDAAQNFVPASVAMESDFAWLRATGRPTGFGWMAEDLHPAGPAGDATIATAAKGAACIAHGAAAFIALLQDVARFDISGFGP